MSLLRKLRGSVRLWFGIVGRVNQADYRTGPVLAWEIVQIVYWRD